MSLSQEVAEMEREISNMENTLDRAETRYERHISDLEVRLETQRREYETAIFELEQRLGALSNPENAALFQQVFARHPNPVCGYSCNGVNLVGDEASIKAVQRAFDEAAAAAYLREELARVGSDAGAALMGAKAHS